MLDKLFYLGAFHREVQDVHAAASRDLGAPIPSCPGWTETTLIAHLTHLYAGRSRLVRARAQQNILHSYEDLGLPAAYREWFSAQLSPSGPGALPAPPPGLLDLFLSTAATLEAALGDAEPSARVWTWHAADQTAGFWLRRMALETAVHRWDAQLAHGEPSPIEAALACDGVDETFDVLLPRRRLAQGVRQGAGESYHFHRTDGQGEWLVRFAPDGVVVTREHARGDVAVRGTAGDLLLFLWHRLPAERLEIFGDATLLLRYFELVPPN
jgi:uncharacterized protein (TIGR03083 family)